MALEDLPDEVCSSFLDGYCWADPPDDDREDLATAIGLFTMHGVVPV